MKETNKLTKEDVLEREKIMDDELTAEQEDLILMREDE
jgi:hypothetical protein